MTRTKRLVALLLGILATVSLLAIGGSASVAAPSPQAAPLVVPVCTTRAATNPYLSTKTVSTNDASFYTSTAWTNLACGAVLVTIPRGRRAVVVVHVDAEVLCTGADGQWCQGRAIFAGVEGQPNAPEPDSFAWANSEPNPAQWEANTFTRTWFITCVANGTTTPCGTNVIVQVRNHTTGLTFRVDDSTVHAQATYF
jgi:hypothetical protein